MDQQAHTELIAQIDRLQVPHGQLALWSLGQSGFVIKGGQTIGYIDPYLSDRKDAAGNSVRRFPAPLDPSQAGHAQVVFTTHEHGDHTDVATLGPLMAASAGAMLISTPQGRELALQADIADDRIRVARLGERVELGGLAYTAIPAAHYSYEVDQQGRSRWMGFLIECNGVALYHSGDTVVIPQIFEALAGKSIDIALLPINGRDFFREQRNITGNMWPGEAIELALRLKARLLLATHNDVFAHNRVSPGLLYEELDRRAPWQPCHQLQPGELYLYTIA